MKRLSPSQRRLLIGVLAGLLLAVATVGDVAATAQSWLAAYLFWVGLPVGALFLVLAHALIGGSWGATMRPALSDLVRTMPLLALFLLPAMLGLPLIYPWADGTSSGWLDPRFFAGRAIVHVAIWTTIALQARRHLATAGGIPRTFAWPCLILLFATCSLAAFDWVMTLEPRWTSSIFGLLETTGWVLSGLAVAVALTAARLPEDEDRRLVAPSRLLLALVVIWAYLSVIQLIVIWELNVTGDIPWYLRRVSGGWRGMAAAIALLQFLVPFLLLLWRPLQRSRRAVLTAAAAVIFGHLLETWWLTGPDFSRPFGWREPLAAAAMGLCVLFILDAGGRFRFAPRAAAAEDRP